MMRIVRELCTTTTSTNDYGYPTKKEKRNAKMSVSINNGSFSILQECHFETCLAALTSQPRTDFERSFKVVRPCNGSKTWVDARFAELIAISLAHTTDWRCSHNEDISNNHFTHHTTNLTMARFKRTQRPRAGRQSVAGRVRTSPRRSSTADNATRKKRRMRPGM